MPQEIEPTESSTPRDLQRAALRALIDLSARSAAEEQAIEEKHVAAIDVARSDLTSARMSLDQQIRQQQRQAREKVDQRTGEIKQRFDTETAGQQEQLDRAIARADHELSAGERDIKKQYDQQAWLAESVYEATVAQSREDERLATVQLNEREEKLTEMEGAAGAALTRYGAMDVIGPEEVLPPVIKEPEARWGQFMAEAEGQLRRLQTLAIPRLFVGVMPLVVGLGVIGLTVGGTHLMQSAPTPPDIKSLGIAGGIALVALVILAVMLRIMGRKQIRATYVPLRRALGMASLSARARLAEQADERADKVARSKRKMEAELTALKQKFAPLRQQFKDNHAAVGKGAQEMFDLGSRQFIERRDAEMMEIEQWKTQASDQIEQRRVRKLDEFQQRHDTATRFAEEEYAAAKSALKERWERGLSEIQDPISAQSGTDGRTILDWDGTDWGKWQTPKRFAKAVRFGELEVDLKKITDKVPQKMELPGAFSLPASLAFPRHSSLLIHTDRTGRDQAMNTLRMVMARLLTSLPAGRARFVIIDPVGLGQNFAGFMHLADHDEALVGSRIWTESEHIEQRLADLTEHMETVIQKYLRNEFETIDEYNQQAGELAEPYRFLVIADFPVGFEGESYRRLASIASSGARCGVYTLILRDLRTPLPAGVHIDELEQHSINLTRDPKTGRFVWKDEVFAQFPLGLDSPPSESALTEMLDVVGRAAKDSKRVEVPFASIAPKADEVWSMSSRDELKVPMGRMGATRQQWMKLGRGVAQHALIAGKTGSGKSTLLHAIVTNLALWYSPDEVELYLVDFKKGVEFKTYASHELPHARAIAVESDREFGLSVLQRIDAELTRRGEMFRRAGVQDIGAYRRGDEKAVLPRILLVIDEFQEFFSEDDKLGQDAAVLLDRLVRQGRAFGIHLLLGSQTISGSSGLSRSTIGQMAVRIALQMSEADSQLILGDANSAARLLSRPGEAIYNDAGGLVEGNSPFQIAWLPDEERDVWLDKVIEKSRERNIKRPAPVVFEGNAPAEVKKNDELLNALEGHGRLSDHASVTRAWLGEPVAIKEPTSVSFRRQSGTNVLIVGQADEQAMALMCSSMISLSAQHTKEGARFVVLDGTAADSPLTGVLERVGKVIPQVIEFIEYRAVGDAIDGIAKEVMARQEEDSSGGGQQAAGSGQQAGGRGQKAAGGGQQAVYVFIHGLQRYRALRKSEDGFSFSMDDGEKPAQPDKQFAEILREGPPLGVHVVCWCDTPASVERTLDRSSLREFDNRVLFQMSAGDSSNLIDSPAANKLGFYRALAFSEEQGVMEKFRPYALPTETWLDEVSSFLKKG